MVRNMLIENIWVAIYNLVKNVTLYRHIIKQLSIPYRYPCTGEMVYRERVYNLRIDDCATHDHLYT